MIIILCTCVEYWWSKFSESLHTSVCRQSLEQIVHLILQLWINKHFSDITKQTTQINMYDFVVFRNDSIRPFWKVLFQIRQDYYCKTSTFFITQLAKPRYYPQYTLACITSATEDLFRVYIASPKHEDSWENSRQLCKHSTASQVCITSKNSTTPQAFRWGFVNTGKVLYCFFI